MQAVRSPDVGKIRLDRFPCRILPMESFLNDFFHHGNIVYIPEQAIHLDDVLKGQPNQGKPLFHIVKSAVDLFLNRTADIADAITQKTIIACFDKAGVIPFLVYFIPFDFCSCFSPVISVFKFPARVKCGNFGR